MPKSFQRSDRIGEEIHRMLAEIIHKEVRDPRLQQTSITRVEVTKDLSFAKVYFGFLTELAKPKDAVQLNKAAGFFRSQLARRLSARIVPELKFEVDMAFQKGEVVREMLDKLPKSESDPDPDVDPDSDSQA